MIKNLFSICLFVFTLSAHAISNEASALKEKLSAFDQVNATFVQVVSSDEGKVLNESTGEMTILRPGKFHWQIETPEEELIVSDGETIWYYSPFIEQVTLINFADAINDTPFALIAGASDEQWQHYIVKQQGNQFTVTNSQEVQHTTFIFDFDNNNNISKFVVIEEQGQRSVFELTHKNNSSSVDESLFNFEIPTGVEVDDQR
jgi:outer membrane lipoprotein carrier protein